MSSQLIKIHLELQNGEEKRYLVTYIPEVHYTVGHFVQYLINSLRLESFLRSQEDVVLEHQGYVIPHCLDGKVIGKLEMLTVKLRGSTKREKTERNQWTGKKQSKKCNKNEGIQEERQESEEEQSEEMGSQSFSESSKQESIQKYNKATKNLFVDDKRKKPQHTKNDTLHLKEYIVSSLIPNSQNSSPSSQSTPKFSQNGIEQRNIQKKKSKSNKVTKQEIKRKDQDTKKNEKADRKKNKEMISEEESEQQQWQHKKASQEGYMRYIKNLEKKRKSAKVSESSEEQSSQEQIQEANPVKKQKSAVQVKLQKKSSKKQQSKPVKPNKSKKRKQSSSVSQSQSSKQQSSQESSQQSSQQELPRIIRSKKQQLQQKQELIKSYKNKKPQPQVQQIQKIPQKDIREVSEEKVEQKISTSVKVGKNEKITNDKVEQVKKTVTYSQRKKIIDADDIESSDSSSEEVTTKAVPARPGVVTSKPFEQNVSLTTGTSYPSRSHSPKQSMVPPSLRNKSPGQKEVSAFKSHQQSQWIQITKEHLESYKSAHTEEKTFIKPNNLIKFKQIELDEQKFIPKMSEWIEGTVQKVIEQQQGNATITMSKVTQLGREFRERYETRQVNMVELMMNKNFMTEQQQAVVSSKDSSVNDKQQKGDIEHNQKQTPIEQIQKTKQDDQNNQKNDKNSLEKFICGQVNFYFSEKNYPFDLFMQMHANKNDEKFIPIRLLLNFPKIKKVLRDQHKLLRFLVEDEKRDERNFEIDELRKMIRKRNKQEKPTEIEVQQKNDQKENVNEKQQNQMKQ